MNIPFINIFSKSGKTKGPVGVSYDEAMIQLLSSGGMEKQRREKPSMISFKMLRELSRTLPLVGVCKNTLKHEVTKVRWDLVPVDKKENVNDAHMEEVFMLLTRPNSNRESFRTLLDKTIDDLLDLDAGVWEKVRSREGKIVELYHRDGGTIIPIYDEHGIADDPAYIQVLEPDPEAVAEWSNEDMIYMMMNPQGAIDRFGFGLSPVEIAVMSITSMLMTENYNSSYFDKGTIPPAIINLGEDYTDEQIKKFRAMWLMTLQGTANNWNNPIVNSKTLDVKLLRSSNLDMQFMEYNMWLARIIIAAFEMSPQDVGLTFDINKATGEVQQDISKNKGVRSILSLIREYINNEIIYDFGYEKEFTFEWLDIDKNDELQQAQIDSQYVAAGIMTGNEVRVKHGLDPVKGLEVLRLVTGASVVEIDATPLDEMNDDEIAESRIAANPDDDDDDVNMVDERILDDDDSANQPNKQPKTPLAQSDPDKTPANVKPRVDDPKPNGSKKPSKPKAK